MRSHGLIIAPDIVSDGALSLKDVLITALWHLFYFKASKESFSWRIIPAITFSAHALRYAITTRHRFNECLTGIVCMP